MTTVFFLAPILDLATDSSESFPVLLQCYLFHPMHSGSDWFLLLFIMLTAHMGLREFVHLCILSLFLGHRMPTLRQMDISFSLPSDVPSRDPSLVLQMKAYSPLVVYSPIYNIMTTAANGSLSRERLRLLSSHLLQAQRMGRHGLFSFRAKGRPGCARCMPPLATIPR